MIRVFTLGHPDEKIKAFAQEIFSLPKGAYNLPGSRPLFEKLYPLGVRQIIHDGTPDEIQCMDGHLYALRLSLGKNIDEKDLLRITK
jgi:hypothetical protein